MTSRQIASQIRGVVSRVLPDQASGIAELQSSTHTDSEYSSATEELGWHKKRDVGLRTDISQNRHCCIYKSSFDPPDPVSLFPSATTVIPWRITWLASEAQYAPSGQATLAHVHA